MTGHTPWSEVKAARHRLTDVERRERATTGAQLQAQIAELATLLGWSYLHLRPAQTKHGWRTPVEGPLGAGWPDLFLIRVRDRRLLAIEVKRELEQPTAAQVAVLAGLEACRIPAFIARPSDLRDPIEDSVVGRWLR